MRHLVGRMRRLVYAFSKDLEHHRAAVGLCYAYYNLCWTVKTLRVTPAMQAGVTDHIWELGEFMEAILHEPDAATPVPKPLALRTPAGPARPLPGNRGFLRLVGGAGGATGGGAPAPAPPPPPAPTAPAAPAPVPSAPTPAVGPAAAPAVVQAPPAEAAPQDDGPFDLKNWKPRRLPPEKLSIFGIEFDEPEE
jgi:hypothetical protein